MLPLARESEISVLKLRVIRKEAAEASKCAAMGRDEKRGEVPQSNDNHNEVRAKRVCDVGSDHSWEAVASGECRNRENGTVVRTSQDCSGSGTSRGENLNLFPSHPITIPSHRATVGISSCQPNSRLLPHA